ncbi:MAG: ArnT family glycosyltransferase [Candidatus Kapaibacterium sp.]
MEKIKQFVLGLFLASLLLRVLIVFALGEFEDPELYEHGLIAKNIMNGYGFTMHWPYEPLDQEMYEIYHQPPDYKGAFIPPLNPFLIYIVFSVFGINSLAYMVIMLINSIVGALTPVLAFLIAKELFSKKAAIMTAISAFIFIPAAYGVITFSGAAIYQTLALLVIYLTIISYKRKQLKSFLYLGLSCGLLTLTRAEFLAPAIMIVLFTPFFLKEANIKNKISRATIAFSLFALLVSPWIYRNTMLYGKFTTIVTHPWHEVWRGNNYLSTGGSWGIDGHKAWISSEKHKDLIHRLDQIPFNQKREILIDSVLKEEVIATIKENPHRALKIILKRIVFLWTIDTTADESSDPKYVVFIFLTLVPFTIGFVEFIKDSFREKEYFPFLLFMSLYVFYTTLFGLTNLEIRYQIYLYTLMLPLTGKGWLLLIEPILLKVLPKKDS